MLQRGDILKNRYIVKLILQKGKYSNTYLVEDSHLRKEWVMKEYITEIDNLEQMNIASLNFEKDITVMAGLKYPGVPEFVDHFVIVNKQYVVMEYLRGRSLQMILAKTFHPMYEPDVIRIGIQITDTFDFLHKQSPNIYFRDLKPSNVMVTPDQKVILIDFNLDRHYRDYKGVKGLKESTPGYAPPEQFGQGIFDERTDIYALGAILHQMVTLRDPTEIPNVCRFPRASTINMKVSRELDEIIDKAIAYSPADRYSSARELKVDLEAVLKRWESPTELRPAPPNKKRKVRDIKTKKLESIKGTLNDETISNLARPTQKLDLKIDIGEDITKENKTGFVIPKKYLAIAGAVLIILLGIIGLYKMLDLGNRPEQSGDSAYDIYIKEDRIREYRRQGIQNYNKGVKKGDISKLTIAADLLSKVICAYPKDVVSQVYVQNCHVLIKEKSYVSIAALMSLSGKNREAGRMELGAMAVAQERHNKNHKILPIVIEVYDDDSSVQKALEISLKLTKRKDLFAVVGPIFSPGLQNTSKIFNRTKIVQISPTANCADNEDLGYNIFRTEGDGRIFAIHMINFATKKLRLKRLAVVYDPTQAYSSAIAKISLRMLERMKDIEYKGFTVSFDSPDYDEVVARVKKYNPDGMFFIGYQNLQVIMAKSKKRVGLKGLHLATVSAYSPQLIKAGGDLVEGIIINTYFLSEISKGEALKFVRLFREKYGDNPNFRAAIAYDTMLVLEKAIKKGVTTSSGLLKFLKNDLGNSVKVYGATGEVTFDNQGRRETITLFPITVKNGKFVLYKKK